MKAKTLLTGALVLGSIAFGAVGQAERAAAATFLDTDSNLVEISDDLIDSSLGIENIWLADEAKSDGVYHRANHEHAFWLPNLIRGGQFFWEDNTVPVLIEYDNGTANLLGSIYAKNDSNKKFDVDVWFTTPQPNVRPKKELNGSAYSNPVNPNRPVNTNDWWFYEVDSNRSTLTGVAGTFYDGDTLNLAEYSSTYSAQLGIGANGKNTNMSLSSWFGYTGSLASRGHSDINIDLEILTPRPLEAQTGGNSETEVPEPAMGLLAIGLVGFSMRSLKRKNA